MDLRLEQRRSSGVIWDLPEDLYTRIFQQVLLGAFRYIETTRKHLLEGLGSVFFQG